MSGRRNHRGWIVLDSVGSSDGSMCVDLFVDPGNGYGFEHLRADPEDGGSWQVIGGFGSQRFETARAAVDSATESVAWLQSDQGAGSRWRQAGVRADEDEAI